MSRLDIYYGRITVIERRPGQETMLPAIDPIWDAVLSASSIDRYGHQWMLANLATDDRTGVITGRFGYPGTEDLVREAVEEGNFVAKTINVPSAVSSQFVLDYHSGAIAFERVKDKISPSGFIKHLVALLNSTGLGPFQGALVHVASDYKEFLRVINKVTAVSFEVRPTNPRDRPIFKPLDVGMKSANALIERVHIENKADGLTIEAPASREEETANPAVMGIEMVEEGYGKGYTIDGERDGHPLRYSSNGGGLLRDAIEDGPEEADSRLSVIADFFTRRIALVLNRDSAPLGDDEPDLDADDALEMRDVLEEDGDDQWDEGR
jgi:hypothetical protein